MAALRVDVARGAIAPVSLAAVPIRGTRGGGDLAGVPVGRSPVTDVITSDLRSSGLFSIVARTGEVEQIRSLSAPSFAKWRRISTQALAIVRLETPAKFDSPLRFSLALWDIDAQERLVGTVLSGPQALWRPLAHRAADIIYQQLTGEEGYFNSRIAYIAETGSRRQRMKRLAIMDQDGANVSYLTDGTNLVLSPRFSPVGQMVAYISYDRNERDPKVYILDLASGQNRILGHFPGMTFAPRFSPDAKKVVLSYFTHDASNIYVVDLEQKRASRLTHSHYIDTAPCYAPDGRRIVFESDRSGRQQLYVMNADGSNITQITRNGEGSYATPVWSPRGDLIAFTKMLRGEFMIGVIRPNGTGERILARGAHSEGPTWSPNGRVILFRRESAGSGGPRLWTVDLAGRSERQIETPTFASSPTWSPRLK